LRRLPHTALAAAVGLALTPAAACGGASAAAPPPVLPASAIGYLSSTARPLDAADLAGENGLGELSGDLGRWGFVAGAERTFQGQSKRLQIVVSRTLDFRDASGARAYVRFVHRHAAAYLGDASRARPLAAGRRRGWLFVGAPCACHMASPFLVGVVAHGGRVSWVSVNGPTAGRRALARLLAEAP
jgi:hypothetical protein